ncbi:VOC family protein [Chromobacterium subtsugae]|uniref:VOC family protein n=2 Tax=Chromobacterium subtsugae TaxID=251747 RepID=A0ABS7FEF2_9NEIS|nr:MULTISPECIES: VOC family protein [Chromobacterium]KUM04854.1 drug:proton antiporter [Chromobacterium subtsugae]KZE87744.1 drug:proton antiporter [Chromobacterium sp. F49]MBW7568249.1 VOC family protein [Chromobacterium subtsugae]MBW8288449.1 VOC family protein [Chromobacterium subtsugae]WSE89941.1 VOC family protein [Chromobacterium subtsugae]
MQHPDFVILYVDQPMRSADFYSRLFDLQPIQLSPTFAMFKFASGMRLGLWSRHTAEPAAEMMGGGGEVVVRLEDFAALDACLADWRAQGLRIVQPITDMDFGRTFTALDPDGHRLRAYVRTE